MVRAYKGIYLLFIYVDKQTNISPHPDESNLGKLEATVQKAENINEADIELIDKAKKLIDLIQTKKNLRNSISSKEIKQLEDALEMVNKKGLQKKVGEDYERAQRLVVKLKGMERMRHEILKLNQPTISEIASYKTPPPHVNMVMKVTQVWLSLDFSQEFEN